MSRGVLRIAALAFIALLVPTGCNGPGIPSSETERTGPVAAAPTPEESAGHERMVALLRQLADESAEDNTFVGQGPARALRERLAALPADAPLPLRWRLHRELGPHELRLGNVAEALEHLRQAYDLLPRLSEEMPRTAATQTVLALAIAQLRDAEVRNCSARHTSDSCIFPIRGGGIHTDDQPARRAIDLLQEVLERSPARSREQLTARWLLNIAYMTIGAYPDDVPPGYLIPLSTFGDETGFPRFVNRAPELGLDTFDMAGGVVAEDFDADGFVDLVVSTSYPSGPMRYFRNNGDGSYSERTDAAGLTGVTGGLNMNSTDYDNDGDVDILVLRGAWWGSRGQHPNSLLRNEGNGAFLDVTFSAGLGDVHYPTQAAAWGDYDNDGDLDVYIGSEHGRDLAAPSQLFRNNGDGTFTDVAAEAGVTNDRYAKAASWGDFDGDRLLDLYVSNMSLVSQERGGNRLYRNNGDGTFTDVAVELGLTAPQLGFPAWFWDYDNDGALDLFSAGYGGPRVEPDVWFVAAGYLGIEHGAELDRLYRGDGRGGFEEVGVRQNLTRPTLPMGANFGDVDNDGYPDFCLGTGYPRFEGLMPNLLFHNERGRGFTDVTIASGFGHLQKGHGISFADLDNDGDLDLFAQIGGMYAGDAFSNALFENPGFGNHWLAVKLVGVRSNRPGIGARLRADLVEQGTRRSVYKWVNSGGSFGANPLHRQHLGLGSAGRVERLEVYWPTTGRTQVFRDVPSGRYIEITEGADSYRELPYPAHR